MAAFRETVGRHLPPGGEVLFTGYPVAEAEYAAMLLTGFGLAQAAGVALMAATLFLTFRSWTAVVLPLLAVGLSTVLVLGVMEVIGQKLTFTNASVPLIMLVLGVAETSFFVSRFHEEAAEHWDAETPVRARGIRGRSSQLATGSARRLTARRRSRPGSASAGA